MIKINYLFIGLFSSTYANTLPYATSVQEQQTFLYALFALAIMGIFALYFSSTQITSVHQKHNEMIKIQTDIEQKQQMILEFMSKRIEQSTKGIVHHKKILMQNSFEKMTPEFFNKEIKNFEKTEALLLDATHELVDFLQIKTGNLKILEESYRLSNVLNDTHGFVSDRLQDNKIELIYDIDPIIATEFKGDSKRIEQILRTFLTDIINDIKNSVVSLRVSAEGKDKKKLIFELHAKDKKMTEEESKNLFSTYTLKEEYKTKEKLDLYVAQELIKLMGGALDIQSSMQEGTYYKIELPYQPEKTSFLLSSKSKGKHVLVVEKEQEVGQAIAHMFEQHGVNVKVYCSPNAELQTPNFYNYDMVVINTVLLTDLIFDRLKKVRNNKKLQVIELKNVYNKSTISYNEKKLIDVVLQKPLQNEQIFDILEIMIGRKENRTSQNKIFVPLKEKLGVHKKDFRKFSHVYVLIAEDNSINQKILRGVLADSGMKIIMVNNGQEALDEVKRNKELDLIFMDINMPTMDGYEATKEIRKIYDEKYLPIVAISAVGFQNDLDKMASAGANSYLHKPFQIGELYSAFSMFATEQKSKIKDIECKLSRYVGDKEILDIQKGISYTHTAIFYKEVLKEVLVNLKDSNNLVEKWANEHDDNKLKSFTSDTLRLAETIGARSFSKVLREMDQLFIYKKVYSLKEYSILYAKEWGRLQKEIEEYLKC